ncbi:MAG: type II toxin-antitoxin system VapC family toxin [Myxococcaceae bacterium]
MPGAEPGYETAVLDASVAVRWVVTEAGSDQAAELLRQPIAFIAPRLLLVEAAAALRRKVGGKELTVQLAAKALEALVDAAADGTIRLADDEDLVSPALMLALTLGHKVPDCLYLALAEREGAGLVTADHRLDGLARARGIATRFVQSS